MRIGAKTGVRAHIWPGGLGAAPRVRTLGRPQPTFVASAEQPYILGGVVCAFPEYSLTPTDQKSTRLQEATTYASDVGVLGVLRGLTRLRGLILLPIIGRGLGAATYGVWTQSLVAVSVGMSIIVLQLDTALVRFVSGAEDRQRRRDVFLPILALVGILGLALTVLTFLFPDALAALVLGDPAYVPIARWLGIWTGLTAVAQLGLQLQRGVHRVKLYGALSTLEALGQMTIVAVLILVTGDLLAAILGAVAWEFLFASAVLALALRDVGFGWPNMSSLRPSLQFSLPLVPSYYAGTVLSFADRLVVAAQLGSEAVGIYAAAYSLARIVRELFVPVSTALLPAVSRTWDLGDKDRARWMLSFTLRYSLGLTIPALAGLAVLGPAILDLLAAKGIAAGAAQLIPLLGIGYLFAGTQSIFAILLQIVRDTRALAISRGIAAIAYVPFVLIGVAKAGLVGGACATLLGYALDLGLAAWFTFRRERLALPMGYIGKSALASLIMAVVVALIPHRGLGGLALAVVAGLISFAGMMAAMGAFGRQELSLLRRLLGQWSKGDGRDSGQSS